MPSINDIFSTNNPDANIDWGSIVSEGLKVLFPQKSNGTVSGSGDVGPSGGVASPTSWINELLPWIMVGQVGAGIYSGISQGKAATDAAKLQSDAAIHASDAQAKTAADALALNKQQWETAQANMAPWLNTGKTALGTLSNLLGLPSADNGNLPYAAPAARSLQNAIVPHGGSPTVGMPLNSMTGSPMTGGPQQPIQSPPQPQQPGGMKYRPVRFLGNNPVPAPAAPSPGPVPPDQSTGGGQPINSGNDSGSPPSAVDYLATPQGGAQLGPQQPIQYAYDPATGQWYDPTSEASRRGLI